MAMQATTRRRPLPADTMSAMGTLPGAPTNTGPMTPATMSTLPSSKAPAPASIPTSPVYGNMRPLFASSNPEEMAAGRQLYDLPAGTMSTLPATTASSDPAARINPFTAPVPTSTPYGTFTPPDPSSLASDPNFRFRIDEGQRGVERSAAARGTLLSGGLLKKLERYRQGLASEEGDQQFQRALAAYNANRATHDQNFAHARGTFDDSLDAYRANQSAMMGVLPTGSIGETGPSFAPVHDNAAAADALQQRSDDAYAAQVAATRAANEGARATRPYSPAMTGPLYPMQWSQARRMERR